ncbi:MAG: FAD-binding protein [Bacteroidetes bacterium]|jgi:glycolate oxidase|nr:FAD-binding protein [Bacteroidota bacterium]
MKQYKKLNQDDIESLAKILGPGLLLAHGERKEKYARDYTEDLFFMPDIVLLPHTVEQVSAIMSYCHAQCIPVTPRGAGTGLSGGALPVHGGICLSLEKMDRILHLDPDNYQVTVEPGLINQHLREAVEAIGLFYPPDPASKGSCFIGGNLAENSGGPKAVKYGVTRDYVLNLEVVLPTGEVIWTGANVLKYATGYNLTHLMVGSEGTLGIITKAVLKLVAKPSHTALMLVSFNDLVSPCRAVGQLLKSGVVPSALEYMERSAVEWSQKLVPLPVALPEGTAAVLYVEVDGFDEDAILQQCERVAAIMETMGCTDLFLAQGHDEQERLWKLRRVCGEAIKMYSVYKEEDTVVPRYKLPELLLAVKEIGARYGFESVCYGHAGDGNLHVNILRGQLSQPQWETAVKAGIRELFGVCKRLGGTISGEHGIGWVQKEYLDIVMPPLQIALMAGIKRVFDPKGILNPDKIFDLHPTAQ